MSQKFHVLKRQLTPEYENNHNDNSEKVLQNKCSKLFDLQLELENLLTQNDTLFAHVKKIRSDIKETRAEILDTMQNRNIETYEDDAGNTFTCKVKIVHPVSLGKIKETLDEETLNTYKRMNTEEKYIMRIKKQKV
jgi:hypothetical protein